jgi:hypothetical protein
MSTTCGVFEKVQLVVPAAFQVFEPMAPHPAPFQSWFAVASRRTTCTRETALLSDAVPETIPLPAAWTDDRILSFVMGFTSASMAPVGAGFGHAVLAVQFVLHPEPQASVLLLPKSHSSLHSRTPLPQEELQPHESLGVQSVLHPEPQASLLALPASHCSLPSTTPLPQTAGQSPEHEEYDSPLLQLPSPQ